MFTSSRSAEGSTSPRSNSQLATEPITAWKAESTDSGSLAMNAGESEPPKLIETMVSGAGFYVFESFRIAQIP